MLNNFSLILQKPFIMADDKKIIFSMAGVGNIFPPSKQVMKEFSLTFYYG